MKKKSFLSKPGVASVLTAFAGVVILMIIFAFMNPNFIKQNNLMTLTRSICPYLLVGIGQGIVCITGNIDLSIVSVLGMSAMMSATLLFGAGGEGGTDIFGAGCPARFAFLGFSPSSAAMIPQRFAVSRACISRFCP